MSDMGIKDQVNSHHRVMNNMAKKQRSEIDFREKIHNKNISEIEGFQKREISSIDQNNNQEVYDAEKRKDQVLIDMGNTLEKSRNVNDRELKKITNKTEESKRDHQAKLAIELARLTEEQNIHLEDMGITYNQEMRRLDDGYNNKVQGINDQRRAEMAQLKTTASANLNNQRNDATELYNMERDKFDHINKQQQNQYKKTLLTNHVQGQKNLTQLNESQVKERDNFINNHQKISTDQQAFFEKKYQTNLGDQQVLLNNLTERNEKIVNDIKKNVLNTKELASTRSSDPFYNFVELKPTVKETPEGWEVKFKVPEHSKDNVQLTTNNREIIVSVNRRFQEERTDVDGTKNRIQKVETAITNLPVKQMIDPRFQKKSWENGVLTYQLKKA